MLARWPGRIKPGVSAALVSQIDFSASLAALVGQPIARGDAPDSVNTLPALLGQSPQGRDHLVEHAGRLSLRQGTWKYIEPGKGPAVQVNTKTETGNSPQPQLYNLDPDLGETGNVATQHPDVLQQMQTRLQSIRDAGVKRGNP